MKERPICDLRGLKGVKRRKVDGYMIRKADEDYIRSVLENGCACVSAGDNGSINIWKTDAGVIRGEAMRFCFTIESKVFTSYVEVTEWADKWIKKIKRYV